MLARWCPRPHRLHRLLRGELRSLRVLILAIALHCQQHGLNALHILPMPTAAGNQKLVQPVLILLRDRIRKDVFCDGWGMGICHGSPCDAAIYLPESYPSDGTPPECPLPLISADAVCRLPVPLRKGQVAWWECPLSCRAPQSAARALSLIEAGNAQ